MKYKKLYIIIPIVILLCITSLVILLQNNSTVSDDNNEIQTSNNYLVENNNQIQDIIDPQQQKLEMEVDFASVPMQAIFPNEIGFRVHFCGPVEIGESRIISDVIKEDGKTRLVIKGNYDDESDDQTRDNSFSFEYIITDDYVEDSSVGIVLKKPLVTGNQWEHRLKIKDRIYSRKNNTKDKEYSAITKISEIKGKFIITETTAEGVDDYKEGRYWKKSVYEYGRGLVFFTKMNEEGHIMNFIENDIYNLLNTFYIDELTL